VSALLPRGSKVAPPKKKKAIICHTAKGVGAWQISVTVPPCSTLSNGDHYDGDGEIDDTHWQVFGQSVPFT
jgi:hypothetical protein